MPVAGSACKLPSCRSLNDALKGRPRDAGKADLYMQRARCHMELRHFHDAMDDALDSVKLDENRSALSSC